MTDATTTTATSGFTANSNLAARCFAELTDLSEGHIVRDQYDGINRSNLKRNMPEYRLWFSALEDAVDILTSGTMLGEPSAKWRNLHDDALRWVRSDEHFVGSFTFIVGEVMGWPVSDVRRILLTDPHGIKRRIKALRDRNAKGDDDTD